MTLGGQSYQFTPGGTQYQDYTIGPFTGTADSQTLQFKGVAQTSSTVATAMLDNVRFVPASNECKMFSVKAKA